MSGYFPLLLPIKTLFMKQKLIILFLFGTIVTSISAQNSLDRITIGINVTDKLDLTEREFKTFMH